jgi:subtilase family serine protease
MIACGGSTSTPAARTPAATPALANAYHAAGPLTGTGEVIAVIDAYSQPNIRTDSNQIVRLEVK